MQQRLLVTSYPASRAVKWMQRHLHRSLFQRSVQWFPPKMKRLWCLMPLTIMTMMHHDLVARN